VSFRSVPPYGGDTMSAPSPRFNGTNVSAGICAALVALLCVGAITKSPTDDRMQVILASLIAAALGGELGGLAVSRWNRGDRVASRLSIAATTGIALIAVCLISLLGPAGQAASLALLCGATGAAALLFRPKPDVLFRRQDAPRRPDL